MKKVCIHQPEHLPWLGFLHKVISVDEFVFLDNVQYEKNYFQNRAKIRTREGWNYITVPVKKFHSTQKICEMEISYTNDWQLSNANKLILNYSKTNFFDDYYPDFEKCYTKKFLLLRDFNMVLINYLLEKYNIDTKIFLASDLIKNENWGKGTEMLLNICKNRNADMYLSGQFGKNYLDLSKFEKENIRVEFQKFEYPVYKQKFEPFIPNMSSIDLLFNYGEDSLKILKGD